MLRRRAPPRAAKTSSDGAARDQRGLGLARRDARRRRRPARCRRGRSSPSSSVAARRRRRRPPSRRPGGRPSGTRCRSAAARARGSRSASPPGRPRSRTGRRWNSSMSDDALAARRCGSPAARRPRRRRRDRSSDGSAWQSAPPIVPRLRTTGSAITRSASVKIGSRRCSSRRLQQRAVARHRADPDLVGVLARCSRARPPADRCRSRTPAWPAAASSSAAGCARRRAAGLLDRALRAARAPARRSSRAHTRTVLGPAGLLLGLSSATSLPVLWSRCQTDLSDRL